MKKTKAIFRFLIIFSFLQILMTFTKVYSQSQWEQNTIQGTSINVIVDVDFINANTGFIAVKVNSIIDT